MADYISREAAIAVAEDSQNKVCPRGLWGRAFALDEEQYDLWQNLIERLEAIPAADVEPVRRWIPCSERLPEDGQDVLIWDNIDKTSFTGHYVWCDGWTVDGYAVNRFHFDITHWMPLPEPPEEGGMTDVRTR